MGEVRDQPTFVIPGSIMENTRALTLNEAVDIVDDLRRKVNAAIFGQDDLITETLVCFLSGGHILMTGAPGLAKTTLVRVFAQYLGVNFGRVQFTPDLLPSDIIGTDILNIEPSGKRSFEFSHGPIFANLLLADEINRASPRTQSALLEAMQEKSCTVGGTLHRLPDPFMVFATQNPFESEGTFPLPEAQLDRFLLHTLVTYPDASAEEHILKTHAEGRLAGEQRDLNAHKSGAALDHSTIHGLLRQCQAIRVDDAILRAVTELVRSTRPESDSCPEDIRKGIWYGAGPRAGISLISAGKGLALLDKSEEVRWHHIKRLAKPVLRHRVRLSAQAGRDRLTEDRVIDELIDRLESRHKFLAKGVP